MQNSLVPTLLSSANVIVILESTAAFYFWFLKMLAQHKTYTEKKTE